MIQFTLFKTQYFSFLEFLGTCTIFTMLNQISLLMFKFPMFNTHQQINARYLDIQYYPNSWVSWYIHQPTFWLMGNVTYQPLSWNSVSGISCLLKDMLSKSVSVEVIQVDEETDQKDGGMKHLQNSHTYHWHLLTWS